MNNMLEKVDNFKSPSATQVARARARAGLTEEDAAQLLHVSETDWEKWESGEYTMAPAYYELFLLKTGQKKLVLTKEPPQKRYDRWYSPTVSEIRQARKDAHLTVDGAAKAISVPESMWKQWESGQPMNAAFFDLFLVKTGQKSLDTCELYCMYHQRNA